MRNNTALKREAVPPPEGPEYLGDHDIGNDDRAEFALAGVIGFTDACKTDDEDAVADFLCDLMHLLDRMPKTYGTWADNLRRAQNNYDAEISPASGPLANVEAANLQEGTEPYDCAKCGRSYDAAEDRREGFEHPAQCICDEDDDEPSPCRQHKDTGRGVCCYCGVSL